MRSQAVLSIVFVMVCGLPIYGQNSRSLATVTSPEVVVRASPKVDGADTGVLFRETTIIVDHLEGDDWVAIQPPQGSLSWVNHLFVEVDKNKPFPQNAVVSHSGTIKLAAGKIGINKPLETRKATIPDGSIVRILGAGVKSEDDQSIWYPIQPPADDFRYLPRSSIQLAGPAKEGFIVKSPTPTEGVAPWISPASASLPATPRTNGKPAGWPNHPLWVQAEQASQNNDYDKAERLYFQLAKEMNAANGDTDLANLCYSRIHTLRERRRQPIGKETGAAWNAAKDLVAAPRTEPKADLPRESTPRREEPSAPAPSAKSEWTGTGFLRIAAFKVNGKAVYALDDDRGKTKFYATSSPNVDLEKYLRKTVDLFGTVTYPADLRNIGLINVTRADTVK